MFMLDILEAFRIQFAGRPLLLAVLAFAALTVLDRLRPPIPLRWPSRHLLERLVTAAALSCLLAYVGVAVWYAQTLAFFDNAEPTMVAVGWLHHAGRPLYHAVDSAERYSHIYGPLAFIANSLMMEWFGPSIYASKSLGVAAAVGSLGCLFGALRQKVSLSKAMVLPGCCALLFAAFRNVSFWNRPDSLQLLCIAAALLFAARGAPVVSAVGVGVASGVLWNLKFTGPLYSLPVFAIFASRAGLRPAVFALLLGIIAAAMPFVAYSNVSFDNYFQWISLSARTGVMLSILRQNIEWAIFLAIPLLLSYYSRLWASRPIVADPLSVTAALLAGVSGVVIAGAKPGAGPYHLLPFVPTLIYLSSGSTFRLRSEAAQDQMLRAAAAFIAVAVAIAASQQAHFVAVTESRDASGMADDIVAFASTHSGVVEVGYGSTESLSHMRPVLVFKNSFYMLDQPAVREHQLAGLDVPATTGAYLTQCKVNYWLIPKGEQPFSGVNTYAAVFLRNMYPDSFRATFEATHSRIMTTSYYDVWRCNASSIP